MSSSDTNTKEEEKSPEELEKERQEATQNLDQILSTSRPKNLAQGLTQGCGNIVAGAVGAVGIAVLAPTVGLAAGMRSGGVLGGVVGVTGGAVIGVLGAAALAISGAVSGVVQMGLGIVAVPQSVLAPRQGKWWNESEGRWVLTNMDEEQKKVLEGVPEDDADILGKLQHELDEAASAAFAPSKDGKVKDPYYYECLEVPVDADQSAIKRKYYLLARKYHPDKTDDPADAEKFKNIAEAYQVLSDPELRAKYDKEGKGGLSADKTDVADGGGMPKIDPTILFAFLFGSDKFNDYIGRLSTATSASVGDSPKVSLKDAKTLQKRRVTRLAIKMIDKVTPWVTTNAAGDSSEEIEAAWKAEAVELSKASFGYQLVVTIGKIYDLLATFYEGSMDSGQGLPSLSQWASKEKAAMDKRRAANKNQMDAIKAGVDMMKIQAELQHEMEQAKTEEEKQAVAKKLEDSAVSILLRILWTTTVVDITSTIQETTQMVFFDQAVDKETRKRRAAAVKKLGEIWMATEEPETTDETEKDAKRLYEDAAFAAMLETVKKRDEAAHGTKP